MLRVTAQWIIAVLAYGKRINPKVLFYVTDDHGSQLRCLIVSIWTNRDRSVLWCSAEQRLTEMGISLCEWADVKRGRLSFHRQLVRP